MTYVAAELDPVTAYPDQTGKLHWAREPAIEANFQDDLKKAIESYCRAHEEIPPLGAIHLLKHMAEEHPDFLRILIGDRDAT
mgnify:CR=1 FL=1